MKGRFWAVLLVVWSGSALLALPFGNRRYDISNGTQLWGAVFGAVLLIIGVAWLIRSFRR